MSYRDRNSTQRVRLFNDGPTMTKTSFKESCDINVILRRAAKGEVMTHLREGGAFRDLPPAIEFHEAMNMVLAAEQAFQELPSDVRRRFQNDPGSLLAFVEDASNREEAIELGLIDKPASPAVDAASPAPAPSQEDAAT